MEWFNQSFSIIISIFYAFQLVIIKGLTVKVETFCRFSVYYFIVDDSDDENDWLTRVEEQGKQKNYN